MQEIKSLRDRFESDSVRFRRGRGDFVYVDVDNDFAQCSLTLHGAHVLRYAVHSGHPVLWMSRESRFAPGESIRGGVPICWPWFGSSAAGKPFAHGYARLCEWDLIGVRSVSGGDQLDFELRPDAVPPHLEVFPFSLTFTVTVGSSLTLALTMVNHDAQTREVSCGLHSYFAVSDIGGVQVSGLEGVPFWDALMKEDGVAEHAPIRVNAHVDRVYTGTTGPLAIDDSGWRRRVVVEREGSSSVVVWNPWQDGARRMTAFGDEEYREMICVETTNAMSDRRRLAPGEQHRLACRIREEGGV